MQELTDSQNLVMCIGGVFLVIGAVAGFIQTMPAQGRDDEFSTLSLIPGVAGVVLLIGAASSATFARIAVVAFGIMLLVAIVGLGMFFYKDSKESTER